MVEEIIIGFLECKRNEESFMRIILGSKSARRRELMDLFVPNYEIIVSNADETLEDGLSIEEQSKKLGYIKAKAVFDEIEGDRVVIGSDTMVMKDGRLYGKPKDFEEAVEMLNTLKNTKHQVITSIAILSQEGDNYAEYIDYDIADVYFKDMTQEEIVDWINEGKCYDQAGGYAIQDRFAVFVDKVVGNYSTVVGLPIHKVYEYIKKWL